MILFLTLVLAFLLIGGITLLVVGAGSAFFTIIFSDVIVCVAIIALIIRWIVKRKKN